MLVPSLSFIYLAKESSQKAAHKMLVKLTKGLTWTEAYLGCKQLGARLPEIRTAAENADILKLQVNGETFSFNC
jgi:hypothetical protein